MGHPDTGPLKPGIFRGLRTLSVMPTFTCTAACKDCGTLSNPQDRNNLSLEAVLSSIDQAKELGFGNVVFTGGEATLRWKDLLTAIAHAHELGFPTRVVTNAYWATSPEKAGEKIDQLIAAGLDEINYSTGDEHTRFVPIERVIDAMVAAVERGLRTHTMIEMRKERRIFKSDVLEHPKILALDEEQRARLSAEESPWMPLDPAQVESYPENIACNGDNIGMRTGCDSILQTYVMQADGNIGSCCGLGMRIIPELHVGRTEGEGFLKGAIEKAENDFLKVWMHYVGPEKILAWAAEKNPEIEWENMYAHRCQACLRIYQDPRVAEVIREHYMETFAEVLQAAYLEDELIPERMAGNIRTQRDPAASRSRDGDAAAS